LTDIVERLNGEYARFYVREARDEIVRMRAEMDHVNKAMDLTVQKIIKVEAERDELHIDLTGWKGDNYRLEAEMEELQAECDRLREVTEEKIDAAWGAWITSTESGRDAMAEALRAALKGDTP
jgi:uncharacterized coiled-coil DUF342 family protein